MVWPEKQIDKIRRTARSAIPASQGFFFTPHPQPFPQEELFFPGRMILNAKTASVPSTHASAVIVCQSIVGIM